MSSYHRLYVPGGSYFFTIVAEQRMPVFADPRVRGALRSAIAAVRVQYPFDMVGIVLLPDHLHMVWALPERDSNFPLRIRMIKTRVTKACAGFYAPAQINQRRIRKRYGVLWQHRYWEHALRDADDFRRHLDYLHWNPMKHGLVERVRDWPWSSFHRFVKEGLYPADWCGSADLAGYALAR